MIILGIIFRNWGEYCIPCEKRREKMLNTCLIILKGIATPFISFGRFIKLLYEAFIDWKNNSCPSLEWKEEKFEQKIKLKQK